MFVCFAAVWKRNIFMLVQKQNPRSIPSLALLLDSNCIYPASRVPFLFPTFLGRSGRPLLAGRDRRSAVNFRQDSELCLLVGVRTVWIWLLFMLIFCDLSLKKRLKLAKHHAWLKKTYGRVTNVYSSRIYFEINVAAIYAGEPRADHRPF